MGTLRASTGEITTVNATTLNGDGAAITNIEDEYVQLSAVFATTVGGGDFTNGAWRTRPINTEELDDGNNCTLSGDQFTLLAGTYEILCFAQGYSCAHHQTRLYNISDAAVELVGHGAYSHTSSSSVPSVLMGRFTIASTKTFEIQHRCVTTKSGNGMGVANNFGVNERYLDLNLRKLI